MPIRWIDSSLKLQRQLEGEQTNIAQPNKEFQWQSRSEQPMQPDTKQFPWYRLNPLYYLEQVEKGVGSQLTLPRRLLEEAERQKFFTTLADPNVPWWQKAFPF